LGGCCFLLLSGLPRRVELTVAIQAFASTILPKL
jgi:hypothetical protein